MADSKLHEHKEVRGGLKDTKPAQKRYKQDHQDPDSPIKSKSENSATLDLIMQKLDMLHVLAQSTKSTMETAQSDLASLKQEMIQLGGRISEIKSWVNLLEDHKHNSSKTASTTIARLARLERNITELKVRNRRGNFRIFGLPEGSENQALSCEPSLKMDPHVLNISLYKDFEIT
ncbi:hypothetical protein NDU88_010276 [Pleurodeles waltl]|uniref:Uncharacterized protein n=1 Tax=Pleurodeles waltl TaxID=8319 RepID=A0AAV7PUF5_PLEWA|nr:hypothetical protein NDU88_010276 [Pleurodeles waltl]